MKEVGERGRIVGEKVGRRMVCLQKLRNGYIFFDQVSYHFDEERREILHALLLFACIRSLPLVEMTAFYYDFFYTAGSC